LGSRNVSGLNAQEGFSAFRGRLVFRLVKSVPGVTPKPRFGPILDSTVRLNQTYSVSHTICGLCVPRRRHLTQSASKTGVGTTGLLLSSHSSLTTRPSLPHTGGGGGGQDTDTHGTQIAYSVSTRCLSERTAISSHRLCTVESTKGISEIWARETFRG